MVDCPFCGETDFTGLPALKEHLENNCLDYVLTEHVVGVSECRHCAPQSRSATTEFFAKPVVGKEKGG